MPSKIFLPKYSGYLVDNPVLVFSRSDGKKFAFDEVSTSSLSNTANALTITGGQGAYPLAYVDTDRA